VLEIHHYSCGAFILRIGMGTIRVIFGSVWNIIFGVLLSQC
jgi:hypothetical protein